MNNPITTAIDNVIKMDVTKSKCHSANERPNMTEAKAAVLPTDKSITPDIRHSAIPTAIMPLYDIDLAMVYFNPRPHAGGDTIGAPAAGTITESATIPVNYVISDGWVDGGEWIGFDQASGTVPAGSFFTVAYLTGK